MSCFSTQLELLGVEENMIRNTCTYTMDFQIKFLKFRSPELFDDHSEIPTMRHFMYLFSYNFKKEMYTWKMGKIMCLF